MGDTGRVCESRIIVAHIVRERDEQLNAKRLAEARASRSWCSVRTWQAQFIDYYNRSQENTHVEVAFPLSALTTGDMQRVERKAREKKKYKNLMAGAQMRGVDEQDCVLAFAAFGDRGVEVMKRPFSNPAYKSIHLRVTREEFLAALNFAIDQIGKPFDSEGASWRLMVWPARPSHKKWWCCALTHAILKRAGMLTWYPLNTLDVDDVVRFVRASSRRIQAAMMPRSQRLAASRVTDRLFSAYPAERGVGDALNGVVDALDTSCRNIVDDGD